MNRTFKKPMFLVLALACGNLNREQRGDIVSITRALVKSAKMKPLS
jgi:hypothetical protein